MKKTKKDPVQVLEQDGNSGLMRQYAALMKNHFITEIDQKNTETIPEKYGSFFAGYNCVYLRLYSEVLHPVLDSVTTFTV